jgi:hypothetical protein
MVRRGRRFESVRGLRPACKSACSVVSIGANDPFFIYGGARAEIAPRLARLRLDASGGSGARRVGIGGRAGCRSRPSAPRDRSRANALRRRDGARRQFDRRGAHGDASRRELHRKLARPFGRGHQAAVEDEIGRVRPGECGRDGDVHRRRVRELDERRVRESADRRRREAELQRVDKYLARSTAAAPTSTAPVRWSRADELTVRVEPCDESAARAGATCEREVSGIPLAPVSPLSPLGPCCPV